MKFVRKDDERSNVMTYGNVSSGVFFVLEQEEEPKSLLFCDAEVGAICVVSGSYYTAGGGQLNLYKDDRVNRVFVPEIEGQVHV